MEKHGLEYTWRLGFIRMIKVFLYSSNKQNTTLEIHRSICSKGGKARVDNMHKINFLNECNIKRSRNQKIHENMRVMLRLPSLKKLEIGDPVFCDAGLNFLNIQRKYSSRFLRC
jgi:hypothetical protein